MCVCVGFRPIKFILATRSTPGKGEMCATLSVSVQNMDVKYRVDSLRLHLHLFDHPGVTHEVVKDLGSFLFFIFSCLKVHMSHVDYVCM